MALILVFYANHQPRECEPIPKTVGKRIANVVLASKGDKDLGYLSIGIGALVGLDNIVQACTVEENGQCAKTTAVEMAGLAVKLKTRI